MRRGWGQKRQKQGLKRDNLSGEAKQHVTDTASSGDGVIYELKVSSLAQ